MSSPNTILIFGPTGAVASNTAREVHKRGASVHLAMRETSKPTPELDSSIPRIQADLSDPSSLAKAVQQTHATSAFVYTIFSSPDHMASSFTALRDAGIKFIVLLSSFTVRGSPDSGISGEKFIGAVHAKTEVALVESGVKYVAVRPAYFNSNVLWNKAEFKTGEVGLVYPDVVFDFIAPSDIGIVCGAILSSPPAKSENVYLCGPELITQRKAHEDVIAKALGKEVKVKELNEQQWLEKNSFMPPPVLDSLLTGLRESSQGKSAYPEEMYGPAVENIRKYKGAEPMGLGEWVEANKGMFE
jgi:uncharacterized protein YbjT (DUF2867 family)